MYLWIICLVILISIISSSLKSPWLKTKCTSKTTINPLGRNREFQMTVWQYCCIDWWKLEGWKMVGIYTVCFLILISTTNSTLKETGSKLKWPYKINNQWIDWEATVFSTWNFTNDLFVWVDGKLRDVKRYILELCVFTFWCWS